MRVLHVNVRYSEGGAARIARTLHEAAKAAGLASTFAYGYGPKGRRSPLEKGDDVLYLSSPSRSAANLFLHNVDGIDRVGPTDGAARRFFSEIAASDVIHLHAIHSYFLPYRPFLEAVAASPASRVIWTLHDNWVLTGRCAFSGDCDHWRRGCAPCPHLHYYPPARLDRAPAEARAKRALIGRLQRKLCFVCINPGQAEQVASLYPEATVVTVSNGLDPEFEGALGPQPLRTREFLRVLVVGADLSDPRKQDLSLIAEAARLDGVSLTTVGRNSPFTGERVTNLGHILDRPRLASIYAEHDVVLFTSSVDPFGLVIVEALAAGTPVVASPSPGAKWILPKVGSAPVAREEVMECLRSRRTGNGLPSAMAERQALARTARAAFGSATMIRAYLDLYSREVTA